MRNISVILLFCVGTCYSCKDQGNYKRLIAGQIQMYSVSYYGDEINTGIFKGTEEIVGVNINLTFEFYQVGEIKNDCLGCLGYLDTITEIEIVWSNNNESQYVETYLYNDSLNDGVVIKDNTNRVYMFESVEGFKNKYNSGMLFQNDNEREVNLFFLMNCSKFHSELKKNGAIHGSITFQDRKVELQSNKTISKWD